VRDRLFDDLETPSVLAIGEALRDDEMFILMPAEGAILMATPWVYSSFVVHQAAVPEIRGADVVRAGRLAVRWMFDNVSACQKLVGLTPSYNVPAIASAKRVGFSVDGCLTGSVVRDGKLHDLIILGLARGEVT